MKYVVHFNMCDLRRNDIRKRAGKRIRAITKQVKRMKKKGYNIEVIKPQEYGYTGKGLFYGVRITRNNF